MKKFELVSANPQNKKWDNIIKREQQMYKRQEDLRSEFERDANRISHCNGYKRLKNKTQVFFAPTNDHICTRSEHVIHVENISYTIANYLGLNTELTKAIAIAHDIGHTPFGHEGERILSKISEEKLGKTIWHEKNGLHFVDDIELLEDTEGKMKNLNLTYAVRDGIISHCGEIDENSVYPREEVIDLNNDYTKPNEYMPYTWEACVVKVVDKISYIGRDIEDAIRLNILTKDKLEELNNILKNFNNKLNNTNIIHELVYDICTNSSIENGICFTKEKLELLDTIKRFNYKNIYKNERIEPSKDYFNLVINQIFNTLYNFYDGMNTHNKLKQRMYIYPNMIADFLRWLMNYSNIKSRENTNLENKVLYNLENEKDYIQAIIDYIAGMTDKFAMECYTEIISF